MKRLQLSDRLSVVLQYIAHDSIVADIGTDHGYIPVYLAQNDMARKIIAADVRSGPLAHAQASAKEYGVSDRIEFVQTDGLDGLDKHYLDTIVIAGMGGETIAEILEKAPWTKAENVRLILQPQSKQGELLSWLSSSGYDIIDASLALDDGRIYAVILAGALQSTVQNDFFKVLLSKKEPLLPLYLTGLIVKLQRAITGLEKALTAGDELVLKKRELELFMRMKGDTDKWQK